MPLFKGSSRFIIRQNYKTLRKEGYGDRQSWAIALKHSRKINRNKRHARIGV